MKTETLLQSLTSLDFVLRTVTARTAPQSVPHVNSLLESIQEAGQEDPVVIGKILSIREWTAAALEQTWDRFRRQALDSVAEATEHVAKRLHLGAGSNGSNQTGSWSEFAAAA